MRRSEIAHVECPACHGDTGISGLVDWSAPCPITGEVDRSTVYRASCCDSFIRPVQSSGSAWVVVASFTEVT